MLGGWDGGSDLMANAIKIFFGILPLRLTFPFTHLIRFMRRHNHHHHPHIGLSKKYSILSPFYGESEFNSKNSFEIRRRMGDCEGDSATNGFTVCGVFSLGALLLTTSAHTFFLGLLLTTSTHTWRE